MYARIAAALIFVAAGAAANAAEPAGLPSADSAVQARDSIPPNCTLNPWTHKYVCHKWPKGTVSKA